MKIISLLRNGDMRLMADSALGRDSMPLFLPPDEEWLGHCRIAVRIGRLGKCVAPKFALRYVEAVTALLTIKPAVGKEPSWLPLMDSAVTAGTWIDVPDDAKSLAISCNGATIDIESWRIAIIVAITQATKYATIKTGDIIIPDLPGIEVSLQRNSRVEASLMGHTTLSLKVK